MSDHAAIPQVLTSTPPDLVGTSDCIARAASHLISHFADSALSHLGKHRIPELTHDGGTGTSAAVPENEGRWCHDAGRGYSRLSLG